jgi:hypothetical protein
MRIEQLISPAKVLPSEFISAIESKWNRIPYLSETSASGSFPYQKIVNDLFTFEEVNQDFLRPWFAKYHD